MKGSAAEVAGLQEGDIITAIDGNAALRVEKVSDAIQSKNVGDVITINYLRGGDSMQTTATLKARNAGGNNLGFNKKHFQFRDSDFDFDFDHSYKHDPCKVFIGVYTSTRNSTDGVKVTGVIDDTPGFEAGLKEGDIIMALDGVPVSSHRMLLTERDKHNQGDEFTITYIREGESYTVNAKFKTCEEKEENNEDTGMINIAPGEQLSNQLDIDMTTFPNPSTGQVNVQFNGEKTATTVSITDMTGKEIFREEISDFDGYYDKKVNLKGAALGAVVITVQQGNQVYAEKIMYVPSRA